MEETKAKEAQGNSEDHRQDVVTVTVNNDPVEIHRGRQTVAHIKSLGNVPSADILEQLIDGKLTELDDNGSVTIKGGEVFSSQPRTGSSSHA